MDEGENRVLRIQFDEDLQPAARRNHGENGRVHENTGIRNPQKP